MGKAELRSSQDKVNDGKCRCQLGDEHL